MAWIEKVRTARLLAQQQPKLLEHVAGRQAVDDVVRDQHAERRKRPLASNQEIAAEVVEGQVQRRARRSAE